MPKILRDPLTHFLFVGAVVFALLSWHKPAQRPETIVIDADQVSQLVEQARRAGVEHVTRDAVEPLIEDEVRDEVLYREALALGLDENDDDVRRRLIEKMTYITEDLADPQPATQAELEAFYDSAPERFAVPALVTFDQLFFNPSEHGASLDEAIEHAHNALAGGHDPSGLGDKTPLRAHYESVPREQIAILFGDAIAATLFEAEPGHWLGPFESDFGLHLVRLDKRTSAYQPPYDEVREQVLEAYGEDARRAANDAQYRKIRDHYDVVVEWPKTGLDTEAAQ